jgi:hypothetical protein
MNTDANALLRSFNTASRWATKFTEAAAATTDPYKAADLIERANRMATVALTAEMALLVEGIDPLVA